eukprot:202781_1
MASKSTVSMDDAVLVEGLFDVDALVSMDDMEGADDAFQDLLKVDDKSAELHYRYGNFIRRQYSDFERAQTEWKLAVQYDANHTLAIFALAMLNKNEFQNYGESIKYFKRVLDIKPTFGIAWKEYGDLLGFRLDDWKNAEYAYDQSVKYQHAFQWNALNNASYGLGFKLNKPDKAEKCLLRSIEISPHGINHANLGRLYFDVFKDDEKAEKVLRAGLDIQENQSRAREYLGKVLAKKKDDQKAIDEAKKHWVRAIELGNETAKPLLEALIQWETKQAHKDKDNTEDAEDSKEEEKQVTVVKRNTLTILEKPSSSIAASSNRKILCSGDAAGNIILYDLMSLDPMDLQKTGKYSFYFLEGLDCNEICFSADDTLLAAAYSHPTSNQSTLVIFNISVICNDGLSKENIAKCSEPLYKTTLLDKINENALKFSGDSERLMIGTTLKYGMEIPLYTMSLSDGTLSTSLYSKVLLNQASWPTAVNNPENVTSLDLVQNILCCGTSKGRILIIDVSSNTLLYQYHHRETNCAITAVLMTTDLRWIISSDIYGAMNFYFVQLKTDGYPKPAAIGSIPKTTIDAKSKHDVIYDIVFIKGFDDVHFRNVSELQGYKDKLICSSSYDGNLALFELTNNDFYTNKPTVRVISRVESSHDYLAINSSSWIITDVLGLCLFTTGDDLRIQLHGLTDILLEAVPEFLQMHKSKKKHRHFAFDANDTDKSRQVLADLIGVETHKLNGWQHLWAFDLEAKKKQKEEEARTADMAIAALSTFQRLTDSVILYLIEDKVKYERVFKKLVSDPNDIEGLAQIESLFKNKIKAQSYYDEKIKQKNGDLIQLLSDANRCNDELQTLANELAADAAVSGMYEGNPGIKKMTRSVEKALLKCMEFGIEYDSGLDFAFLKDLARAGVTCRDCMKIAAALGKLVKNKGIQVLRIKNRFVPQSELGYRDILVNLRFVDEKSGEFKYNGHIAELQLHHEKIQAVRKKGKGHANYSASRFLMDFIRITTKKKKEGVSDNDASSKVEVPATAAVAAPQQTIEK